MNEASPHATYQQLLADRRQRVDALERLDRRLSASRGFIFLGGLFLWWLVVGPKVIPPWVLVLPVAAFVAVVVVHERTAREAARARSAAAFYVRGVARLEGGWAGQGDDGRDLLDEHHPYAADLDVLGRGSLFELMSAAATNDGRRRLASWLLAPATSVEVRSRQQAVAELAPLLPLREQLAVLASEIKGGALDSAGLVRWASASPPAFPAGARLVTTLLGLANLAGLAIWPIYGVSDPLLVSALASAVWAVTLRGRVHGVIAGVSGAGHELALLADILRTVESTTFGCDRLRTMRAALSVEGHTPSQEIARLARLLDLLESRRNQMFMPVALPLLWTTQMALGISAWRRRCGPAIGRWVDAVAEFEALGSLAGHAWEHPADTWPEVVEGDGPAIYVAEGAGHPLLPESRCVRNDVELGDVRLLLVSGSNMSGKSTLLRTVGTNAVLALAGAPVRARRLRLSVVQVGASIRVQDSLLEGASRFYAEITRLRKLMDLARERPPLLFLLDEVLHGTNSADRKAGAEAIVQGLLDRGALGLVTTHDLALAESVAGFGAAAKNVHFEDRLEEGGLQFDYLLKPGVVRRSNAMALMRAVGLIAG